MCNQPIILATVRLNTASELLIRALGLPQDQLIATLSDMEKVWENPLERDLFRYNPDAKFKINLVFDDRQQKTIDERNIRQTIDLNEQSYDKLVAQYNTLSFQHQNDLAEYNNAKAEYEARLKAYNAEVSNFNKNGGATNADYKRLNDQKKQLQVEQADLELERLAVNAQADDINSLTDKINEIAKRLNKDVNAYNGKFGNPKQFDQGTYTGTAINIFQFNDQSDLSLVIAHEFGHSLKLEHVQDPKAIMYYLMDQQDLNNVKLTDADLNAVKDRCGIN